MGSLVLASAVRAEDTNTWWALKPLLRPPVPKEASPAHATSHPIDAFIRAKLAAADLVPSAPASRQALLRRLTFDLIGLPPSPQELDSFLHDPGPGAYERVVDRLLTSPRYGERWARHWMDAAHFAETHGHDQDRIRTNAWPYRDYLIASFNADKPYAQFVQEQVAGDVLFPDDPQAIVALGFLAAGPWDESSLRDIREDTLDRQIGRYLDRDDILTTVMQTFTSTTAQCARCHDHKFDPISQGDYYALQAVFAGVDRANRRYDSDPVVHRHRAALRERQRRIGRGEESALYAEPIQYELANLPRPALVYAAASDFEPDGGLKPSGGPRPVHRLIRGDITKPQQAAEPGAYTCVATLRATFDLVNPEIEGTRRAALARWLTHPDNPLTWRSIVNRCWHLHFGRGLVETPNDFGRMGGVPSHPELLDWLACEFRDGSQSLKALHRLIVTSATYRQAASPELTRNRGFDTTDGRAGDPENRLLSHGPQARLDAEQVRDAILLMSGRLDLRMGGPSDQQFELQPGIHVTPKVDYAKFDIDGPAGSRRGVYRFLFRTLPDPFMDALDCPAGDQLTPVRNSSVTVQQALALWNNAFVIRHAKHFATALEQGHPTLESRIVTACLWTWGRSPRSDEVADLQAYATRHGLANLCRLLFNSNEFMFVN